MNDTNIGLVLRAIEAFESPEILNEKFPDHQSVVYKAENPNTGDFYIGATINKDKRISDHIRSLKQNKHNINREDLFQKSYNKDPNFVFKTVPTVDNDTAFEIEKELISLYKDDPHCLNMLGVTRGKAPSDEIRKKISDNVKAWYNNGGISPNLGKKLSDERKEKISAASKEMWKNPETRVKIETYLKSDGFREKIKILHTGKIESPETRLKKSLAHIGMPKSDETRAKLSASIKGVPRTPEAIEKSVIGKKIAFDLLSPEDKQVRLDRHMEISKLGAQKTSRSVQINGVKYNSVTEARVKLKLANSTIYKRNELV